jgi:predicted PurR-regulated permease PerM
VSGADGRFYPRVFALATAALLAGVSAFAPIGLAVSPVVAALTLALLRFAEGSRRA